jgi:hypothetical protein
MDYKHDGMGVGKTLALTDAEFETIEIKLKRARRLDRRGAPRLRDLHDLASRYFPKSKNFMTPDVLKRGKRGRWAYELSTGLSFDRSRIWGVTVVDRYTGETNYELSKCAHSESEAKEMIFHLRWIKE